MIIIYLDTCDQLFGMWFKYTIDVIEVFITALHSGRAIDQNALHLPKPWNLITVQHLLWWIFPWKLFEIWLWASSIFYILRRQTNTIETNAIYLDQAPNYY